MTLNVSGGNAVPFQTGQEVTVGQLHVEGKGRRKHDETLTGSVTHTGLSKGVAEAIAKNDGPLIFGAHSAIHEDTDGTFSVIQVDISAAKSLRRHENALGLLGGLGGAMIAQADVAETLRNSAKANPGFTFID